MEETPQSLMSENYKNSKIKPKDFSQKNKSPPLKGEESDDLATSEFVITSSRSGLSNLVRHMNKQGTPATKTQSSGLSKSEYFNPFSPDKQSGRLTIS